MQCSHRQAPSGPSLSPRANWQAPSAPLAARRQQLPRQKRPPMRSQQRASRQQQQRTSCRLRPRCLPASAAGGSLRTACALLELNAFLPPSAYPALFLQAQRRRLGRSRCGAYTCSGGGSCSRWGRRSRRRRRPLVSSGHSSGSSGGGSSSGLPDPPADTDVPGCGAASLPCVPLPRLRHAVRPRHRSRCALAETGPFCHGLLLARFKCCAHIHPLACYAV